MRMTRIVSIVLVALAVATTGPRPLDGGSVRIASAEEAPTAAPTTFEPDPSPSPTVTPLPTAEATLIPTEQPSPTFSPTPTMTAIPTATEGVGETPSASLSPTPIPATTASATASPRPAPTPVRRSPTPKAASIVQTAPACSLAPTAGVVGQTVALRCAGFAAGDALGVKWRSLAGNLAVIATDGAGTGSVTFAVPDVGYGARSVIVTGSNGVGARATFTVRRPSIALSPATGTKQSSTTVRLRGFSASESVAINWYSLSGSTVSTIKAAPVSDRGAADVVVAIPRNAGIGGHRIDAVGASGGHGASTVFSVIAPGGSRYLDQGLPGCGRIAILFNIGIGYPLDTGVLNTLKARGVPATMFAMGWWADANPRTLTRLANDGYLIGSHGYARQELTSESDDVVRADIRAASAAIERITGAPSVPWFTPYAAAIDGRVKNLIVAEGYTPVGWRISAADYDTTATEGSVYSRVVGNAYDGAIVEFHIDGPATAASTGRALPRIIDTLRARGFTFVSVPQMAVGCSVPSPFRRPTAVQVEMIGDVRRVEGRRTGA